MEPDTRQSPDLDPPVPTAFRTPEIDSGTILGETEPSPTPPEERGIVSRIFLGPQGLRAGWSVLIFIAIYFLAAAATAAVLSSLHLINLKAGGTPLNLSMNELILLVGLLAAASLTALIERRRLVDYNLTGVRRLRHFFSGMVVGFVALSILMGGLKAGGWLRLGGPALSAGSLLGYAFIWGCIFLMVGVVEEGTFRCYLQYTLTRGINFWWALAVVGGLCAELALRHKGNGVWGDYAIAILGLLPCLWLYVKRAPRASFWYAAWATSTLFGFVHTGNGGENWVGIFSAAAIGFIFCVSIYVTGSAWWAIGCHAAWDWGESYFYGTADSGLTAKGHLLSTAPAGNPLWSGGADGPEGSLLILGILVLLLAWLAVVYGRKSATSPEPSTDRSLQS